ncbi:MAG: flagellar basal body P-ring formation protein FlgA [Burkholderiales bacterium]|nr:flagellar basal body P-ring formation protein FlgA [Phycisphaerae bacterium]
MRNTRKQSRARSTILFIIVIALLAQLCSSQLAHGQPAPVEKFITAGTFASGVSVELRGEAIVVGGEVRFRQIARWSDADKPTLDPIGDLIIARFGAGERYKSIGLTELRTLFTDAGVNISTLNFVGPMTCALTRSDQKLEEGKAIEQLVASTHAGATGLPHGSGNNVAASEVAFAGPATMPTSKTSISSASTETTDRSLRELLTADLAQRVNVPIESLQITFKGQDDGALRLTERQCSFSIDAQRASNLGEVSWYVRTTNTDGPAAGTTRTFISATARAWQDQLVVAKTLGSKQLITEADVVERRALVDRVNDDPLLKRDQVVGQVAGREIRAGTVVTAKLVDAVQLIRAGQFITIEHATGAVKVKIVAKALDAGSYGQSIRVLNQTTREVIRVTVTGPQQAAMVAIG